MGKLIFLGTAGEPAVANKQSRASGGIILQEGKIQFHLDPGPGALLKALEHKINPRENTAVLVSSADLTKCNDINLILSAMSHDNLDVHGILVVSEGVTEESPLMQYYTTCVEKLIIAEPNKKIGIENIELIPTNTNNPQSAGFKIRMPNKTITYTSDINYAQGIEKQYENSDILIINVKYPFNAKKTLNSEQALDIIKNTKPKLAILTGFGKDMILANPNYEAKEIQKQTRIQTLSAMDGMIINTDNLEELKKEQNR